MSLRQPKLFFLKFLANTKNGLGWLYQKIYNVCEACYLSQLWCFYCNCI